MNSCINYCLPRNDCRNDCAMFESQCLTYNGKSVVNRNYYSSYFLVVGFARMDSSTAKVNMFTKVWAN